MGICIVKAVEILTLNVREAGSKMPPDVKDSVELGVKALVHILDEHDGKIPEHDPTTFIDKVAEHKAPSPA